MRIPILIMLLAIFSCNNKSSEQSKTETEMEETMKADLVTVKGPAGNLYVNDGGEGNLPIVFVHSYSGSSEDWKHQLNYLRKDHRAVAPDLRAHGRSDAPADSNYSVEALVHDIEAAVDGLGLHNFILVGHSMGGSAAIAFAGKYPERVAGLMLVGTPGHTPADEATSIMNSLETKYDTVMNGYMEQLLENAEGHKEERMKKVKDLTKDQNLRIIRSVFQYDPTTAMRNYAGPKMIVSTTRESSQPNTLISQFPNVPNKVIDGTSHWPQLDKPDDFNKILIDFINRVESKNR